MAKQIHTLSKAERLKSRKQINQLFTRGNSLFVHPVKVSWILEKRESVSNTANKVEIGVSVSKRNFKKAVDRNRVKRLLRECYRLNKADFLADTEKIPGNLFVFFIYVDKTLPVFKLLQEKMVVILKKLAAKTREMS